MTRPQTVFSLVAILALCPPLAQAQFQDLVSRVPHSANAVVILNVEKAKNSPTGKAEGLAAKLEQAFRDGTIRIPPSATRFVQAAQIDLEFMSPVWEAAVMELTDAPSMELIAKAYRGEMDNLDGLPAVALPQDAYVVRLGQNLMGAMSPANRQAVVRWLRESKAGTSKLSPYLEKAAGYSDRAGTEIIMALDLDGLVSPQRIQTYLQSCEWLDEAKVDRAALSKLLQSVEGIRIGVRLGTPPNGKMTVDFKQDAAISGPAAKRLFIEYLAEKGMLIEDFNSWQPEVSKNTISLAGNLSLPGLRKLLSVVESPVPAGNEAAAAGSATTSASGNDTTKTRDYFKSVNSLFGDLKDDMRDAKNLASTATFFDKYARRIERMPMLGVDKEMLDYGAFVTAQLRLAAGVVRTMGIRTNVRTREITSADVGPDYAYAYGGYGYGRYGAGYAYGNYGGTAGAVNDIKQVEQQRGIVKAQERGDAAASVQEIKAGIIQANADMRRKMTEKYQVQF